MTATELIHALDAVLAHFAAAEPEGEHATLTIRRFRYLLAICSERVVGR
jgi:hypothetical protein